MLKYIRQYVKGHLDGRGKALARHGAIAFFYRLSSAVFSYGLYVFIPVFFGVAELGIFSLAQAWIASLGTLVTLGFNVALLQIVSQEGLNAAVVLFYKKVVVSIVAFATICALVLASFAPSLTTLFSGSGESPLPILATAAALPFQALLLVNVEVIRGMFDIRTSEFFRNLLVLLVSGLTMFPVYALLSLPHAPVVAYTIGTAVSALSSMFYLWPKLAVSKQHQPREEKLRLRSVIRAAIPMMGSASLQVWNSKATTVILGLFTTPQVVGVFSFALKLSTIPDFIVSAIKAPGAPMISDLFWRKKLPELQQLLRTSVEITALFSLPVVTLLLVFSKPLLGFAGESFSGGVLALRLLLIAQLFSALSGLNGAFLNMTQNHKVLWWSMAAAFVLNTSIGWLLVPAWGMNGAAAAHLVGTVTWNTISATYIFKKYGMYTYYRPVFALKSIHTWK